jgi:sulfonate transport system substrate-binding protein
MLHKIAAAFAIAVGVLAPSLSASAQTAQTVSVAIGGRGLVTYLPLTLADQLGYFKDAGINVQINDFAGGAKSIEALVGGSADIAIGAYEHTLVLQHKGVSIKAIALFNRSYGAVIALKPALAKTYKSPADLKGLKMGVTTPGSSGALAVAILLSKANLPPSAVSIIGIGGGPGALAAIKSGQLDGVGQFDPVITEAIHDGDMVPIVDTRTKKGMDYLYGGYIAASSVLTTPKFIKERPAAAKAFAGAIARAVEWLDKATPAQVAATVPAAYLGNNRALYEEAVAKAKPTFTSDGAIPADAAENTYKVLSTFGPLRGVKGIDINASYDNSFVRAK